MRVMLKLKLSFTRLCIVAERRQDQNSRTAVLEWEENGGSYLKSGAVSHHLVNLSGRLLESLRRFITSDKFDKTMRGVPKQYG